MVLKDTTRFISVLATVTHFLEGQPYHEPIDRRIYSTFCQILGVKEKEKMDYNEIENAVIKLNRACPICANF